MNLRHLAIANIINIYGGIYLPSSFICFKSLKGMYDTYTENKNMFIVEFPNKTSMNSQNSLLASSEIIGSVPNTPTLRKYIRHLEILYSSDFGMEQEFLGKNNVWLNNEVNNHNINLVQGRYIGVCDNNNEIIDINDLMSSNKKINLDENSFGVYIPWNELINRIQYQWFVKLSPADVLNSNTNISKYLLLCEP